MISSVRAVQAAGIATTGIAGALVMMITGPQATADPSNPLQPTIDQIVNNLQSAYAYDSTLPFATATSNAQLPAMLQNVDYQLFLSTMGSGVLFNSPETVAGDAADSRQLFQFFTPDIYYHATGALDPDATYTLTGTLGGGTQELAVSALSSPAKGSVNLDYLQTGNDLTVNPDGTFTVDIGPTNPGGGVNYLDDTGASTLLVRDILGNSALGAGNVSLECISDCPADNPGVTTTGLSAAEIARQLNVLAAAAPGFNQLNIGLAQRAGIELPENTMDNLQHETFFGAGLPSAIATAGNFDLQPDQALIVKVPDVTSSYSGIELMNVFGGALPSTLAQTTLNDTQAFHDADNNTYYVISATNPGVANWLDSGNLGTGEIFARFEGVADPSSAVGLGVTTQVVPVADVSQYLPKDTPAVTPAEYAATMNERVLSYDYALDTSRQDVGVNSWVTQQLFLHDLQATMGSDNFHAVFGEQPFTPMWLRLTPALSPDNLALAKDMLTNPSGSLIAIQDNLALAEKDITLPTQLADQLLQQDYTQTAGAVQSAISSGDLQGALTALATGGQQLGTIFNDALFDPNTSITSGLLNARDDLATAVFEANGGFPSQAGPLATLEWEYLPQLVAQMNGSGAADLSSLLTADPGAAGLDLNDLSTLLNPADYLAMLFDPTAIS